MSIHFANELLAETAQLYLPPIFVSPDIQVVTALSR